MYEKFSMNETCMDLKSNAIKGLSEQQVQERLLKNGKNELKEVEKQSFLSRFFTQLNDPLIYVLILAAFVSVFLKEISDAIIIGLVVLVNATIGMIQEGKAEKALESLKKLASPKAYVIRGGKEIEVKASDLVVGDIVLLDTGCQVPADLRLLESSNLKVEESALTGESLPIEKNAFFLASPVGEIPLGDRKNMVYMSTMVTYGRGRGIVTAVGMETELGKIATMINESKEETTPLQKRLGDLGKVLSILSLLLCAALFGIAIVQKRDVFEMLITAISLAVAAVPEGLPAVVTICLALSVTKMVKINTIIRKLPSVETLGAVNVVCSDKTGTLTQNIMTVEQCFFNQKLYELNEIEAQEQREFFYGMTLCNDGVVEGESRIGDPTELALLDLSLKYGYKRSHLEKTMPRRKELSFDSDRKMMSTFHLRNNVGVSYTKGAPDEVLRKCNQILLNGSVVKITQMHRKQIQKSIEEMSRKALRTLAIAEHVGGNGPTEEDLVFVGMVGMKDPARPEVAGAVQQFKQAGVTTVMITGDHVDTAYAIGKQLGIADKKEQCLSGKELSSLSEEELVEKIDKIRIFARVAPEQKVRIVKGYKTKGSIVAMTGDGVNDAPSLKAADIGIAMGKNGTDVAKQAADMILTDDNFATIEKAIEEGRGVYENIRKSVIFLLSSNLGEILTMFLAVLWGMPSPLKSSHILWINLITDSLPALALSVDKNDGVSLMKNQPRGIRESLFSRGGLLCTCCYGILIAAISLTAFFFLPYNILLNRQVDISVYEIGMLLKNPDILRRAQTYTFTVLGMCQLFHAIGMRDVTKSIFQMKHGENKLMIAACIVGFLLQFLVTESPFLVNAFGTMRLSMHEWIRLAVLASFPLLTHELLLLFSIPNVKNRKVEKMQASCPIEI